MKTVFPNREVPHIWAQQHQSEGRGYGNIFFEEDKIYSYGRHFCMGRILPGNDVAVLTTRTHSITTSKQMGYVKQAVTHLKRVYCNDPSASAFTNKRIAENERDEALLESKTERRIKAQTRINYRADAFNACKNFNDYLAALPEAEREGVTPLDMTDFDDLAEALAAQALREQQRKQESDRQKAIPAAERLQRWRESDPTVVTSGFGVLPVALRLKTLKPSTAKNLNGVVIDPAAPDQATIETSHGASVPVTVAKDLWILIQAVKSGSIKERLERRLGNYMLNQIKEDGTIVVGCHTIPYSELELMAKQLKFI